MIDYILWDDTHKILGETRNRRRNLCILWIGSDVKFACHWPDDGWQKGTFL